MKLKPLLLLLLLLECSTSFGQVVTWSDYFASGTPSLTQAQNWINYRSSLIPRQYYKVRMYGSLSSSVMECNNAVIVNDMAAKLRTGTAQTWVDGSNTWNVGSCGSTTAGNGIEFSVNSGNCACQNSPSVGWVIRVGIGNNNWGGMNTATCSSPAQTMTLEFYYNAGMNNAAVTAVTNPVKPFCPGTYNVAAQIKNNGQNRINGVKVFWEVDGVLQPVVNYSGMIDTFNGASPQVVNVPLGFLNFAGSPRQLKIYTSLPNGVADTVNNDDTLKLELSPSPKTVISAAGPTVFCTAGNINVTLNASAGAGNIYQWFRDGNPIPGATNASFQATLAGDYTVRIDSNGCTNTSAVTRVDNLAMPLPLVHPAGYPVLCSGDSITLVANAGVTGAAYQWQFQGYDIPGATNASYTVTSPGNYNVVTSKYICNASSPGINVVPASQPTPMIEEETAGTYKLKTQPVYISYQWRRDGADIAGETNFAITPKQNGSYTVVVSNGGCDAESQPIIVSSVGVNNIYNNGAAVSVYPNPASAAININAPEQSQVIISSLDGKTTLQQVITNNPIDISSFANGIYLIKITNADGALLMLDKLIISH